MSGIFSNEFFRLQIKDTGVRSTGRGRHIEYFFSPISTWRWKSQFTLVIVACSCQEREWRIKIWCISLDQGINCLFSHFMKKPPCSQFPLLWRVLSRAARAQLRIGVPEMPGGNHVFATSFHVAHVANDTWQQVEHLLNRRSVHHIAPCSKHFPHLREAPFTFPDLL